MAAPGAHRLTAMLIRSATADDGDAIWAILEPICASGEVFCVPRDGGRTAAFDYWCSGPGRRVFVAEDEDRILGTSYLRPNQRGGGSHVANAGYATAPDAQGKGVARALLAHSLETARAAGFRAMQFNFVVATNARAVATWEAAGFTTLCRLPDAFAHPRFGLVDALVMHRRL
jgi:GNAT superfamily N-acetyltransferase